jgi:hypothetical protein
LRQSQDNQEVKKMPPREVKWTPEEEALGELLALNKKVLSEAARTILSEADITSYKWNLASSYSFQPEEFDEALQKMSLEATRLTDSDREHLAKLVRAGKAAASSICTSQVIGYRDKVWRRHIRWYHQMLCEMVDEVLQDV